MSDKTAFRAKDWVLITPGANPIKGLPEALEITATGDITMESENGNSITLSSVPVGRLPYRPYKVTAATATVYALY